MNEVLSKKWRETRGLKVVSVALNPITLTPEDQKRIQDYQAAAVLRDPTMAAATLAGAQAEAMKAAAQNENGAMTGFMGMGMAMNAGGGANNMQNLYAMGQQNAVQNEAAGEWVCGKCGNHSSGKFCHSCGAPKPESGSWKCSCGTDNTGNFCTNCGSKKNEKVKCGKCGYEPADPDNIPKFCPECGEKIG